MKKMKILLIILLTLFTTAKTFAKDFSTQLEYDWTIQKIANVLKMINSDAYVNGNIIYVMEPYLVKFDEGVIRFISVIECNLPLKLINDDINRNLGKAVRFDDMTMFVMDYNPNMGMSQKMIVQFLALSVEETLNINSKYCKK